MLKQFRLRRLASALDRDQRGVGLVEFALTFFLVLIVVFGTIEFSSLIYTYTVLANAANEGLRYAIVHSSSISGGAATAVVKQYSGYSLHDTSKITVSVNCASTCAPPDNVTVTVSYTYAPYLPSLMTKPPTMSAYAQGVTVY
jgi:Flp pilus assembly protein TadG